MISATPLSSSSRLRVWGWFRLLVAHPAVGSGMDNVLFIKQPCLLSLLVSQLEVPLADEYYISVNDRVWDSLCHLSRPLSRLFVLVFVRADVVCGLRRRAERKVVYLDFFFL